MAFDCQEIKGLLTYLVTYMLFTCMCIQDQCDCCLGKLEMLRNLTAVGKCLGKIMSWCQGNLIAMFMCGAMPVFSSIWSSTWSTLMTIFRCGL